jgi:uncharacterized protein YcbX
MDSGGLAITLGVLAAWWYRGTLARLVQRWFARGSVDRIVRYPVKGLSGEKLADVALTAGEAMPFDRRWGLLKVDESLPCWNAARPEWRHKSGFHCAFNARAALAPLDAHFAPTPDGRSLMLALSDRSSGAELLASVALPLGSGGDAGGDGVAERFFRAIVGDVHMRLVGSTTATPFQLNNTSVARRVLHLVSSSTVAACAAAFGLALTCERFRPNIVVDDLPPWCEFDWVGDVIRIGDEVECRVLKRTVRCAATCRHPMTGAEDVNVPSLLQKHFPQHGPFLGVYIEVVKGGVIRDGDTVALRCQILSGRP